MYLQEKIAEQSIVCLMQHFEILLPTLTRCILEARVQSERKEYERIEIHLKTPENEITPNWQRKYIVSKERTKHMKLVGKL